MLTHWVAARLVDLEWAAVRLFLVLDVYLAARWIAERVREHSATCERCYQRRHPSSSRAGEPIIPDLTGAAPTLVDATPREAVASTSPQRRVVENAPSPRGVSPTRPWAAASPAADAHPVAASPRMECVSGLAATRAAP